MSDAHTREPNLLIIRRSGAAELDSPKGGVWKIAYADFMTAMMAFFLVMWLINATSETTKTGVANYFNPIKFSDGMQLPKKGLYDPEDPEVVEAAPEGAEAAHGSETHGDDAQDSDHGEANQAGKIARYTEEALFRDPYAVLASIAAEADGTTALGAGGGGSGGVGGADGRAGEIYGDPFDPGAWYVSAEPAAAAERPLALETQTGESASAGASLSRAPQNGAEGTSVAPADATGAALPTHSGEAATARDELSAERDAASAAGDGGGAEHADGGGAKHADGGGADASVKAKLAEALGAAPGSMPNVTVEHSPGGVLISLADQVDFGMFAIGSAEPLPETVAAMEKIAALLEGLPGKVIIRGHTDGRPFRSADYDNWRLSSARAHMAYHMLVRGGLDEARVERIEGYADRHLRLPGSPEAAENRRIEVLVQGASS